MAGFRKAKAEQAAIKMGVYGPSGSGKTLTALLIAEGLAKDTGKRVAFVDTERGTDFYVKDIPERKVHPEAFDVDAMYTKSLMETLEGIRGLSPDEYSAIVIDSITHLWEAARLAYEGRTTRAGTIPMGAWAAIKKPYKELMTVLLSSPIHVIFCGRQGNEFKEDEETGEPKQVGFKMKAEGETPYEPHILLRMEPVKHKRDTIITAFAEKDRSGILSGKTFKLWPANDRNVTFDCLVRPILPHLGGTQAHIETDDEISMKDAQSQEAMERRKAEESEKLRRSLCGAIDMASNTEELKAAGKKITAEIKRQMLPAHVVALRNHYEEAGKRLKETTI